MNYRYILIVLITIVSFNFLGAQVHGLSITSEIVKGHNLRSGTIDSYSRDDVAAIKINRLGDVRLGIEYLISSNFYVGISGGFGLDNFNTQFYSKDNIGDKISLRPAVESDELNSIYRLEVIPKIGYQWHLNKWALRAEVGIITWRILNDLKDRYNFQQPDGINPNLQVQAILVNESRQFNRAVEPRIGIVRTLNNERIALSFMASYRYEMNRLFGGQVSYRLSDLSTTFAGRTTGQLMRWSVNGSVGITYKFFANKNFKIH